MIKYGFLPLAVAACVSVAAAAAPAEVDETFSASGLLGGEIRVFPDDPEWPGQDNTKFEPSFFGRIDLAYTWGGGRQKILFSPYGRFDAVDDRRTHFDAREASLNYLGDGFDVVFGMHQVFWGRAESHHLVNVINQVDLVENFDGEEYLGQPMVNVNFVGEWGKLGLFVMTGFRERTFPARDGRLRGPTPIDTSHALYQSDAEEWHIDFAARYENSVGPLDFGISYFYGNNREPRFVPSGGFLRPFYELMNQVGIDGSYVMGNLVLKAEAIYRWSQSNPFFATVFGGEYTIKDAFEGEIDVGLLLEYNFDDRDATNPGTVFDNDVFGGVRFTFHDESDTQILLGALVDVENGSSYLYVESSRRVGDDWRVGLEVRVFNGNDSDPLTLVDQDSYLQLKATRYFSL